MEEYELGPNGAILYAMDFLLQNIEWLLSKINVIMQAQMKTPQKSAIPTHLFIFDLPGQIELYINTDSVRKII